MGYLSYGTSNFKDLNSAILYYENMGFSEDDVREKVREGWIGIGFPDVWECHYLVVDRDGRFHQVRDHEKIVEEKSWDSIILVNTAGDNEPNEFLNATYRKSMEHALKEANKAMNKRRMISRIVDWIYGTRETALIMWGVVIFGLASYLILSF